MLYAVETNERATAIIAEKADNSILKPERAKNITDTATPLKALNFNPETKSAPSQA